MISESRNRSNLSCSSVRSAETMKENPLRRCGSVVENKKNERREYNRDRISKLPEDIMAKIVSGLPLKEAAATSILSKRWRYIWTFTKNLDFDAQQTLTSILILPSRELVEALKQERPDYIHWVNSVIAQRKKTNRVGSIDRFRVDFDMSRSFSSSIDNWIKFAMKNRVQILELNLFECGTLRVGSDCYILRKKHFNRIALKSLRVLNLTSVDISGKVVEWLLSNCPLLERLQVIGSCKLINLRILGGRLKHLEMRECFNIKKVEICDAQNLVSLYCWSSENYHQFLLRNVPKLVDLRFEIECHSDKLGLTFPLLSSCLSQLQILQLDLTNMDHEKNLIYPMLTNLKQLKLILDARENFNLLLAKIIRFLKVSPCVQRLELLMMQIDDVDDELEKYIIEPTNCPLKEVEMLGYSGTPNEDQLIIYFADNLVALQKVIVHPSKFEIYPTFRRSKDIKTIKTIMEEEKVRDHAMHHIKEKIPTALEFVCL